MDATAPERVPQSALTMELQDEDDEETLQLKLNAIEARLRLKQHRNKKDSPRAAPSVHVPVSPKRRSALHPVNLVSNHSLRSRHSDDRAPRKTSLAHCRTKHDPARTAAAAPHQHSFNDRLAEARARDRSADERRKATKRRQSTSFVLPRTSVNTAEAANRPSVTNAKDREMHSGIDLSRRFLGTKDLQHVFADKELYKLPRLLKEVTSPTYSPPETDGDFVVFGIVASKSNPIPHANAGAGSDEPVSDAGQPKFMVIHLTDLEWEIDLYLFGSGFDSFWKLSVGSVLAVLNPGIMPPRRHMRDSGQFSLKLSSSDDAVLEIGTAAHLGFCSSLKKDGNQCGAWFDSRKADHCEFHISLAIERSRSSRMETNTMNSFSLFGAPTASRGNGRRRGPSGGRNERGHSRAGTLKGKGLYRDVDAQSTAYMLPPEIQKGASAAQMLDGQGFNHFTGASSDERRRKRLAGLERDRNLANALSATAGRGVAAGPMGEQLRTHGDADRPRTSTPPPDARSLGLIGKSGPRLTSSKRNNANAVGWSSALKRGLPETGQQGSSPKKARFDLVGKGLREPGKESREDMKRSKARPSQEDEDDLDIV